MVSGRLQNRGDISTFFMQNFFIFSVSYSIAAIALIIMKGLASSGSCTCFDKSFVYYDIAKLLQ